MNKVQTNYIVFIYFMTERDLFGYPYGSNVKIGLGSDDLDELAHNN